MQTATPSHRVLPPSLHNNILPACILVLFLYGWHWRVTGALSPIVLFALPAFVSLCLAFGSVFLRLVLPSHSGTAGLPYQFWTGYFVFNSLLFVVTLISPLGMVVNLLLISVFAIAGYFSTRKRDVAPEQPSAVGENRANWVAILIACVGATIWCGDAQTTVQAPDGGTVFQIWDDVYIHAREISVFAQSHGMATIQDIKLAGGRAPIYHFASYLSPAAISAVTGANAMQVYASLQLPLGLVLTGLAAYCLMNRVFGAGPGLAAAVAIMFAPDAFQQGFQNKYLSYNFLAQVNLGMLYGIACAALAWMFMFDGCRRGKFGSVLLAYGFLVMCLFYKAHIFVANSYLLMMFPFFFFTKVNRHWRIGLGLLATIVFCLAVSVSQNNPRVPVMRLDGTGIGQYIVDLLYDYDPGWMKREFKRIFVTEKHSHAVQAVYAVAMIGLSTFGLWLVGLAGTLVKGWRTMPAMVWFFPVLVLGNYLVMAVGLAYDTRKIGSPDELINRPLVWAYFVVAAWTAAVGYRLLIGAGLPRGKPALGVALGCVACIGAALYNAPNLQTYRQFDRTAYSTFGAIPKCVIAASTYLRLHSDKTDIVQDAAADPMLKLAALSERQLYVADTIFGSTSEAQSRRLSETKIIANMSDATEIRRYFASNGIDWFLQHPQTSLAWPSEGMPPPALECGGYRLFHFAASPAALVGNPAPESANGS